MNFIYWLVRSYNRWRGDRVKRWIGGIVILASCEYDFIRVDENHVQYPSNNISIVHTLSGKASQIQFFPSSQWCFYITSGMLLIVF